MGSFIISFWSVVVTGQYLFFGRKGAAAIEAGSVVVIDLSLQHFFGLAEGLIGCVAVVGSVTRTREKEDNSQTYYKGCEFFHCNLS
jgi:hypothetical protein